MKSCQKYTVWAINKIENYTFSKPKSSLNEKILLENIFIILWLFERKKSTKEQNGEIKKLSQKL